MAYEDGYTVLRWVAAGQAGRAMPRHIDPASIDISRVYLCGDDAGGNIAHHVAVQASQSDVRPLTVKGLMLLSPLFGGQERTPAETRLKNVPMVSIEALDWQWKSFLPHGSNRDHPACNIFGRNSPDLASVALPPMLVIIGGLDILQDWQVPFYPYYDLILSPKFFL